ncbi:MAG: AAA family ATPase [Candidatus Binatia bacterium]
MHGEAYPHRPVAVELRQTHISWVFLAGDFVFKMKKPVRFAFLDYSTLDRRLFYCREEVRLNRRLAPGVYESVVPILGRGKDFRVAARPDAEGAGRILEYAVRMRRLPAARMLDVLLREGQAGPGEMRAIARRISAFHESASTTRAAEYGAPEEAVGRIREDLAEMKPHCGETLELRELEAFDDFYRGFLDRERPLLERRVREGRIREGHGDLRAEHICFTEDIDVFDCVEFNERLRTGDVASEIAFLAMDLDFLGEPVLARELVRAYALEARDEQLRDLLPLYGCYRACVRGKVETLKSLEREVPVGERRQARLRARRYFRLARRFTRGGRPAALIVVCGPAGTGKTTVARLLGADTGFAVLRSDVIRKRLAGIPVTERASAGAGEKIYAPEFSRRTYERLRDEAAALLRRGDGAIVEATFLQPEQRRPFLELALSLRVPVLFVECRAGEAEILRRLEERSSDPDEASDAGREIYLRQRHAFLPPREIPERLRITVDTETELDSTPERVEAALLRYPTALRRSGHGGRGA